MNRIKISFGFWQEQGTQNQSYTSLMEGDKEIVLKNFNFGVVFNEEHAFLINRLWRDFYQLYINMKSNKTNPSQFANQTKEWLDLFLTPSQGEPNTINFKMVNHLPEFVEWHQKFGLGAFSCSPVEKKNHDQVSAFFRKTMKDGGKGMEPFSKFYIMKIDHCILLKSVP
ncbi:hypothetical protein RhiirA5_431679 [Rhizophagus irregularis]|uniref:Uncharacterized protein n=1 Tax=Rhizophagus irregularis TaxID=588596 RepID=A0A2N0NUK3_9GLOM|nr:hypothetical protein RhiirA5_431679 [Rhizophagus irregularis]